jgi:phosphoadenosine phosphosulfate reductase
MNGLTANQIKAAQAQLATADPQETIHWALDQFGDQCGIAFSGAEDIVLIELAHRTGLSYSVFCLDTGRLHEETYRFLERVRHHYGIEISFMSPDPEALEELTRSKGLFSFFEDGHRECCSIRKVEPLRRALGNYGAWVTGQRKDQSPDTRHGLSTIELDSVFTGLSDQLIKLNPLALWDSAKVWDFIRSENIPYNALHDQGYRSIGCAPCTRPIQDGQHEREGRWWWENADQKECGLHQTRQRDAHSDEETK